ncbi:hypothetical protein Aspvir_008133 [Aspergillus viridinutans]|uniref:hydroxymethylglutaryl-CoA lyase n=1 Tax=Aspergillus viridinutans TaxID=75553 RepID=A0A9P3BX03_ASPVI|nr:uncharacterized protein Aspvir_008133 [Aspergillus viridinutans]GIK04058.1 hypothetical protein Aspvir_008133 [Aspergillus viridinutans]
MYWGTSQLNKCKVNRAFSCRSLYQNVKGLDIAIEHGVKEVAVFISATEGFSKANINCTVQQGIERAKAVAVKTIECGITVRGYVSCIFSDPFGGPTEPSAVLHCVQELLDMGCYEVSLGDTLGVGSPDKVRSLLRYLADHNIPLDKMAGHFHDTYGQAVASVWEAYNCGVRVFDSSVEDLVYMFETAGIDTGVDLLKLVETGVWISQRLSKTNASRAGTALAAKHGLVPSKRSSSSRTATKKQISWTMVKDPNALLAYCSGVNVRPIINRPEKGNALTSSPGSLKTSQPTPPSPDSSLQEQDCPSAQAWISTRAVHLWYKTEPSSKVMIACINSSAIGGGVGAFVCDIHINTKAANVTLIDVKLGIFAVDIFKHAIHERVGVYAAGDASARP